MLANHAAQFCEQNGTIVRDAEPLLSAPHVGQ